MTRKTPQFLNYEKKIYADNFKEAIDTIENKLSGRYIILPVEVSSKADVE